MKEIYLKLKKDKSVKNITNISNKITNTNVKKYNNYINHNKKNNNFNIKKNNSYPTYEEFISFTKNLLYWHRTIDLSSFYDYFFTYYGKKLIIKRYKFTKLKQYFESEP